uniref:Major facilitator superfamily (MFS) profile domain-containing protein n=1 Tax=Plectus sambesii TaxID=2011161 RepID=A0A914W368_9BILA
MAQKFPCLRLFLISLLVSFGGSFHFGYQLVLTNPSQGAFLNFLHASFLMRYDTDLTPQAQKSIWSVIVALLFVGAIIGSLVLPLIADRVGRKNGMYISTSLMVVACVMSALSKSITSFELFTAGRLLFGVAIGLSLGLASLLLSESSPKQCRGFVSMTTGILLQLGIIAGSTVGMQIVFGSDDSWPMIYWVEIVPLIVLMVSLPFIDESPSFLVANGKEHEARNAIRNFYNCASGEVDKVLLEMKESQQFNSKRTTLFAVFKDNESRRGTLVGCVVAVGMAFCGIAVINAFAVKLFQDVGLSIRDASIANIGLGVVSFLGNTLSAVVIDKCGRRPLLLIINTLLIVSNVLIFGLLYSYRELELPALGYCLIAVIALFIFAFGMGPGPIAFFITTEMVSQRSRSAGQSCANITQMLCRGVILAIYLPLDGLIGPLSYAILFIVPLTAATVLLYFYLPETKN